jgi:prolyl-tRNA synthetase
MKLSKSFVKTSRDYPKDETSISCQLLIKAGYIDKVAAGIYTLLPLGLKVVKKIEDIVRDEMEAIGGQEILMPALIPKENWMATGRWTDFDVLFKLDGADEKQYGLGASHEEIVSPLAKKFTLSYRDLPFSIFQIQNKFRDELRAKSGVLRTREFIMKDLYSFHASEADLDSYYDKAAEAYWKIFERAGIKDKTYFVYASGGTFAKYSHEFQTETEAGEDEIYVCKSCSMGANREIIEGDYECPKCKSREYEVKKAIEVGNIFKLKTKYSEPFGLEYVDEKDQRQSVLMGCYGLGIQRLMGAIVEVHHDDKGLVWPQSVSPYSVYLIGLGEQQGDAGRIYDEMKSRGIDVIFDDRDISAGEKFADADLVGVPYRAVISPKTNGKIELKRRDSSETELVDLEELINRIKS